MIQDNIARINKSISEKQANIEKRQAEIRDLEL